MEDKILEQIKALHNKGIETVSASDLGRRLHRDSKDIAPYLHSLAGSWDLEEMKGRQGLRYKMVAVI